MKKSAKKEAMINKFARTVGHAAGTVAKATQGLAASAAALVQTDKTRPDKVRRKPARTSRRPTRPRSARPDSTAKKKGKGAKSAMRRSRKHAS
jgi:hypothetical protein